MKKFFENIYLFSKFSSSIILLLCIIGILYIFLLNYQKENSISKNKINFEEEIKTVINKNTEQINKISNNINLNEKFLSEIKKDLNNLNSQNKKNNLTEIVTSIKTLNENFLLLSKEIENIKNINLKTQNSNVKNNEVNSNKGINEIIDLVLIKYENSINFEQELVYLSNVVGENKINIIEKLYILSTDPFNGYVYLNKIFDDEVNMYIKNRLTDNEDSFFKKIILPYLDVSPTTENLITDDTILKIKEIKRNIDNKKIDNAFKNLITIKNYNNIFETTSSEIDKYLKFKNELLSLK